MKIRIEKEHGDSLTVLHTREMTVSEAMGLAESAVLDLGPDEYSTVIRMNTPNPNVVFSFSRTETTILICLNGKPHAERKLQS